jgi:hypothetical protein
MTTSLLLALTLLAAPQAEMAPLDPATALVFVEGPSRSPGGGASRGPRRTLVAVVP